MGPKNANILPLCEFQCKIEKFQMVKESYEMTFEGKTNSHILI